LTINKKKYETPFSHIRELYGLGFLGCTPYGMWMAVKVSEGSPTVSFFGGRVKVKRVCFTYKAGNLIPEYIVIHYIKRQS
jgi:hypothetical protein